MMRFPFGRTIASALPVGRETGKGDREDRRRHAGYDHSYWFIQSFIADHLRWHAERLCSV
jgi:hypothetical protein